MVGGFVLPLCMQQVLTRWDKRLVVHDPQEWKDQFSKGLDLKRGQWACFRMKPDADALKRLSAHVQSKANPGPVSRLAPRLHHTA